MAATASASGPKSTLTVNVYDGTRKPFLSGVNILYTITDGDQNQLLRREIPSANLKVSDLPFYDSAGDNYTVLVYADDYRQAGYSPVKLSPKSPVSLDLMLVPKDPQMNFADALWDSIKVQLPFLTSGADDATGKARYQDIMENKPKSLASLLNLTTAMK